jgi:transposase
MRLRGNARRCPKSRRLLVERVECDCWSVAAAAEAAGVGERTAYRWLRRWREGGAAGLLDRSSASRSIPHRTAAERVVVIEKLRGLFMTAAEIAEVLGMALSTVSAVLERIGLGKRSGLKPPEPPNRYERKRPGELVHLDVKKLGRIGARGADHRITGNRSSRHEATVDGKKRRVTGCEFVHVAVDDATRLAEAEVRSDERGATAAGLLRRAVAWFASFGIAVERILSDNGSRYRARGHALAARQLAIKRHLFTRPYRPRTNGKAERFIQTLVDRWAHGAIYGSSAERTTAPPGWLTHYNFTRRHGSLGHKPPAARLHELTNLAGNYS